MAHDRFLSFDYKDQLVRLKNLAESAGWTTLRWVEGSEYEWIAMGHGFSGTEQIFIGIQTYSVPASYIFNWKVASFIGYVDGNTFDTQPGMISGGIPLGNSMMNYTIMANPQRLMGCINVQGFYQPFYVGKFYAFATYNQYPYPVCVATPFSDPSSLKFDSARSVSTTGWTYGCPFKGNRSNLSLRAIDGTEIRPYTWPWNNNTGTYAYDTWGPVNNAYPMVPVLLMNSGTNIYGQLDGVFYVSGLNQWPDSMINSDGYDHFVGRDIISTGITDYFAMRMD